MRRSVVPILMCALAHAPAALAQQPAGSSRPAPMTDIYHVHFDKAVPGQAAALGESLKIQDPKTMMPGHLLVLRHQEGDDWDFVAIEHVGTKATLEIPSGPGPGRNLSAWHEDSYVSGPPWADVVRAMGLPTGPGAPGSNAATAVYVVSVLRAVPGHREQLQQTLTRTDPTLKIAIGAVLFQHLEGGAWTFLSLNRYNTWQDFAADRAAGVSPSGAGASQWAESRQHADFHRDTIADRIAPLK